MTQSPASSSRKSDDVRLDRLVRTARAATEASDTAACVAQRGFGEGDASTPTELGATSGLYLVGPARSRVRILLVFEDRDAATATRRMLRRQLPARATFHGCTELDEAVIELRAQRFDVVIADVAGSSPERDVGVLVAAAAHYSEAPIIALGTESDPAVAAAVCALGAQDYLVRDQTDDLTLARAVLCAHARSERTRRLLDVAHLDDLTGVANRRPLQGRFLERRYEALHQGGGIAMLIVDVDRFKEINDSHGHFVGDHVLSVVASRIVSTVRSGDLVARMGGDEFAVMLGPIDAGALEALVETLEASLSAPVMVGDEPIAVSASVGYAFGTAEETTDLSILARRADAEMYRRKRDRAGG